MMAVEVRALDAGTCDQDLVARLAGVVNAAYAIGEDGLWREGVGRTTAAAIMEVAHRGELLVAWVAGVAMGCVRVREVAGGAVEIAMLAAEPASQGLGVGSALMDAAEGGARSAGRCSAQLELLVPLVGAHRAKEGLARWYARRGYSPSTRARVEERYPELAGDLCVACAMQVWRKPL